MHCSLDDKFFASGRISEYPEGYAVCVPAKDIADKYLLSTYPDVVSGQYPQTDKQIWYQSGRWTQELLRSFNSSCLGPKTVDGDSSINGVTYLSSRESPLTQSEPMWWHQRPSHVESRSMPVREQSPDTGISLDRTAASGGISSFGISLTY